MVALVIILLHGFLLSVNSAAVTSRLEELHVRRVDLLAKLQEIESKIERTGTRSSTTGQTFASVPYVSPKSIRKRRGNKDTNDTKVAVVEEDVSILASVRLSSRESCQLGCDACGYNWYEQHYNSGSPSQWYNQYCECCGGTQSQQNVCKLTCAENPDCADDHEYANSCPEWAKMQQCEKNHGWMFDHCMKSCAHCHNGCKDLHGSCSVWALHGECSHNPTWMDEKCPQSCNVCPDKCEDKLASCPHWSAAGECESNPMWMHVNCRKSCDECYHVATPAPTPSNVAPHATREQWHAMLFEVVDDEGEGIGNLQGDAELCKTSCDSRDDCKHFTVCGDTCYLKKKALTGFEARHFNEHCSSYFKAKGAYFPSNPSLLQPSSAPPLTFYMYRAQGGPPYYPQANTNEASLGGVLWYLHNECIGTCKGDGFMSATNVWGDRKFGIDRIRRFKVTVKATRPLYDRGMHFSVLKAFDSGENTGPHIGAGKYGPGTGYLSTPEYTEYGFTVGCGIIGQFPHKDWKSGEAYPDCVWYSLPGACPTMDFKVATDECKDALPGGACEDATGQGNCTYSYEDAGYVMLDELVGITPRWKSRAEFCTQCGTEGNANRPGGCGLDFWGSSIWDKEANKMQVQKLDDTFKKHFPDMQRDSELHAPTCDFNLQSYGLK